jgi:RNA polymerase sigma-70 factor (ECF subfamily)
MDTCAIDVATQETTMRRNAALSHLSDTAMMNAIKAGDNEAETELYERFHRHINRVARRLTQDSELVKDISQESIFAILKHVRKAGAVNDLNNYSASIVIHTYRKLLRNQAVVKGAKYLPLDMLENFEPEKLIYNEATRNLLDVLELIEMAEAKLTEESIELLKAHFILGLSYQEIARELGKSESNIRVMAYRAVKKVREELVPAGKKL